MIFEKGRQATYFDLYIYGTAIEIVDHFKYLGVTLFKKTVIGVAHKMLITTRFICII